MLHSQNVPTVWYSAFRLQTKRKWRIGVWSGHPGLGGSFGLAIPEVDFASGITKSPLVSDRSTVKAVLHHVCTMLNLKMD